MKTLNERIKELMDKLDFDIKMSDNALQLLRELEEVKFLDDILVLRLIHEYLNHFPLIDNDLNDIEEQFFFYKALEHLRFENMMNRKTKIYREKSPLEQKIENDEYQLEEILRALENKITADSLLERENQQIKINYLINKRLTN